MLEDTFKLGVTLDQNTVDHYLKHVEEAIIAVAYDQWHALISSPELLCNICLQRAGHVQGAACIECDIDTPLLHPPKSPERADILVLEITYGDRLHEDHTHRQQRLEQATDQALADHGTFLIPAFSAGRTQELLYEIEDILHRKALLPAEPCTGER
ncbi:hypothetical protein [Pseudomonas qingdaonensis]|uniref:hypothetical protein n=1 Tax=Pseudomonas TaxID=286 RepID=UPI003083F795